MRPRVSPRRAAILAVVLLAVGLAAWYVRDTQWALAKLGREVRADCAFKRDIAQLAAEAQQRPGPVTITLTWDAWDAYVIKGCSAELGRLSPPPYPRPTPR